jgi:hypothetical protein
MRQNDACSGSSNSEQSLVNGTFLISGAYLSRAYTVGERRSAVHLLAFFFPPIFGFGFVLYFLPAIIAFARSKRDAGAIFVLNFFLGWTCIGWVIALVWALKQDAPVAMR